MSLQALVSGVLYARSVDGHVDFLFYVKEDVRSGYKEFKGYPIAVHHDRLGTENFINDFFVQKNPADVKKPSDETRPCKVIEFHRVSDTKIAELLRDWRNKPGCTLENWVAKIPTFAGLMDVEKQRLNELYTKVHNRNGQ